MENSLLVALSRQVALQRELDVVANNVANVNTTGFRREGVQFEEFLLSRGSADAFQRPDRRLSFTQDRATYSDFQPGQMEVTNNPLDVAIQGDGFFVVQTPNGERYTRAGAFQLDNQGRMVTVSGEPVLSDSGPITITAEDGAVSIGRDGSVATEQGTRGRLRVATFASPQFLIKEGNGLFRAPDGVAPAVPADGTVRFVQGMREGSNVKPVLELSRLIELNRAYVSVSSLIQRGDELRKSAIQTLSEIPS
ncbi:MAG: flagellar basal-body rod protein FlgF [bacterium]|jgi:flagellar basal-body rod protein FlgF